MDYQITNSDNEKSTVIIPDGFFCSGNCVGCRYWNPDKKDFNGRDYCGWYDTYYYPRERGGCLSRKE